MKALVLELVGGVLLTVVGFGVLWVLRGRAAFDTSATNAWILGMVVVGGLGVGFLATREWLAKRKDGG